MIMQDTLGAFEKSQTAFDHYYVTHLAPLLNGLEQKRQRRIFFVLLLGVVGFAALGLAVILSQLPNAVGAPPIQFPGLDQKVLTLISFAIGLSALIGTVLIYVALYNQYKQAITGGVCDFLGFDYQLKDSGFPVDDFEEMLPFYKSVKLEDHVAGEHNGVAFEMCEGKFVPRQGDKSNRFYRLMISFDFPRPFAGETVITPDWGHRPSSLLERLRQAGEPVRLESMEFEERFEVYSTDQLAARRLLTPRFMEKLMEMAKRLGSIKGLTLAYAGNQLHLSLFETREGNRFEVGHVHKAPDGHQQAQSIFEDLVLIPTIIDALDLSSFGGQPRADTNDQPRDK
jgi:hypothetical protein